MNIANIGLGGSLRVRARLFSGVLAGVTVVSMAACSGGDKATEAQPSTISSSTSDSANSSPSTDNDEKGTASSYLLSEKELPDGWRHATGEQHLGRPVTCGVVLEPEEMDSYDTIRYTKGFSGPFIVQYSFLAVDEANAKATADRLAERAKTCRSFKLDGRTIAVKPLPGVPQIGKGFSALSMAANGIKRDTITFRVGRHVTVIVGYSPAALPPVADLSAVAESVAEKVQDDR